MGKPIFKLQSNVRFSFPTGVDLSTATVKRIYYTKPDNSTGFWAATSNGKTLVYKPGAGELDQAGTWKFQSYYKIGTEEGWGDIVLKEVEKRLIDY